MSSALEKKSWFTLGGSSESTGRDLKADGTVPLTANWAMGAFELSQATWKGVTVGVGYGGTGLASYAVGDLLYASGTTALSKLAAVATGQVLVSAGTTTAPAWSTSPTLTGTVTANNVTASPTLGTELVDQFANWDVPGGAKWSYGSTKWSHATGDATALVATISATGDFVPVIGTTYKIVVTNTTSTAGGGVAVSLGGQSFAVFSATGSNTYFITAKNTTGILTFTPTSGTWVGSIDTVSIMVATNGIISNGAINVNNASLLLPNGNSTYVALGFNRSTATGMYMDNSNKLILQSVGTEGLKLDTSQVQCSLPLYLQNTYLYSLNANEFQVGTVSTAPPDVTFKGPNASGTDHAANATIFQSGASTGTGIPVGIKLQTAYTGTASNSTAQTQYTREWVCGKVWSLSNNSATALFSIDGVDPAIINGWLEYSIEVRTADSPVKMQSESGNVYFTGVNKVTETWTTNISEVSTQAVSDGTLATTWAVDTTADTFKVTLNSNSGTITPATIYVRITFHLLCPHTITLI